MSVFAIVGPSGAGKDTLIAAALAARPDIIALRRCITRPEAAGGEPFEGITEVEFLRREAAGDFALSWRAHGLSYGVPPAPTGGITLFNCSRRMLEQAALAFPGLRVIEVTASAPVLAQRLASRGRETAEDIAARLARRAPLPAGLPVTTIINDGTIAQGVAAFLAALDDAPNPRPRPRPSGRTMTETVFTNATLVLPDEVRHGAIVIRDGMIAEIGAASATGIDCAGDLIAPGLIELHTDNLERHIQPRPGVNWPHGAAIIAHDAELAGCGITTVFDALRVGSINRDNSYAKYARGLADEILAARPNLRISHRIHLRAEVCSETLIEELAEFGQADRIGIVSLMDHTPGQRQFRDLSKLAQYVKGKQGMSDLEFEAHVAGLAELRARFGEAHEAATVQAARDWGAVLASHDDTTADHVATSAAYGIKLAEFPTTVEAAQACRKHGIATIMGAPNLIRGGSHSGNVSAGELAQAGLLDIVSSDYVPAALLSSAVLLGDLWDDLARGFATVTAAPARSAGLSDRGRLGLGLRADLIRVARIQGMPVIRETWVAGRRVA